jgi:hypothetical protein
LNPHGASLLRSLLFCCGIAAALLAAGASAARAQAPADFAGTWALDKGKSRNLAAVWDSFHFHYRKVTQNARLIVVESEVGVASRDRGQGSQTAPPGDAQPRRRRGGRGLPGLLPQSATYNLDGSETRADEGGVPASAVLTAKWKGKALELTNKFTGRYGGNDLRWTITELWELSEDGKLLSVRQTITGEGMTQDSTLVFTRR